MKFPKSKKLKVGIFLTILIISLVGVVASLLWPKDKNTIESTIVKVTKNSITENIKVSGKLLYAKQYNANFETSAQINEINVSLKQKVKAGQQLAKIDTIGLEIEVSQANQALIEAKKAHYDACRWGYCTSDEDTKLKEGISVAEKKYTVAKNNLEKATLKSPFDGIVIAINFEVGDVPAASRSNHKLGSDQKAKSVITIVEPSSMQLEVKLSEDEAEKVKVGQLATIASYSDFNSGKVVHVDDFPIEDQGIFSTKARISLDQILPNYRDGKSLGAIVEVNLVSDVLTLPITAVKSDATRSFVTKITEQGTKEVEVTLGASNNELVEIKTGLEENDEVIMEIQNPEGFMLYPGEFGNLEGTQESGYVVEEGEF